MLLPQNQKYKGDSNYDNIISRATDALGEDEEGYRTEFISLVEIAKLLDVK